jgi:hypothetical protein
MLVSSKAVKTVARGGDKEVKTVARVPLRMYFEAPSEEITYVPFCPRLFAWMPNQICALLPFRLEEFESFALDRLTVLKHIEKVKALGKANTQEAFTKVLKETGLDKWDPANDKDKDKLSHFVLRIAFCTKYDCALLSKWLCRRGASISYVFVLAVRTIGVGTCNKRWACFAFDLTNCSRMKLTRSSNPTIFPLRRYAISYYYLSLHLFL